MSETEQDRLQKAALVIRRLKERIAALEQGEAAAAVPIAVVGVGCRFPGGADGPAGYWELLAAGRDAIAPLAERWALVGEAAREDVPSWAGLLRGPLEGFDAEFFGVSPREAASLDPQHRLLLEVGWEALEDAGLPPHTLAGSRTGVFVGACVNDYGGLVARRLGEEQDAYAVTGNLLSVAAGRLAYTWGLQGPCMTIDTACSSSLVAVHLACRSLRAGESDLALAGGVNVLLSPLMMGALGRTQALAPDGRCKTFDALANGFARGEGCGVVVLKRLADAQRAGDRVWAVIRGSAVNQDGRSTGLTAPNVRAQEALIREALRDARAEAAEVGFVETHGTGTSLGDPIEVEALRATVGAPRTDGTRCVLGAVKTNLGHLEAAAGVAGLIKAALALHHRQIPQNLHFRTLNPRVRLTASALALASEPIAWPRGERARLAGVSSFGMSGTNAHVILEEAPESVARHEMSGRTGAGEPRANELSLRGARNELSERTGPSGQPHDPATARPEAVSSPRSGASVDMSNGTGPIGPTKDPAAGRAELVVLSARSDAALAAAAKRLHAQLSAEPAALADLAFSLATTRSPLPHRLALVASSPAALAAGLAEAAEGATPVDVVRGRAAAGRPRVVFVFPGQGGQWAGMGRQLLAEEPVFRARLTECDRAIQAEAGFSVLAALTESDATAAGQIDVVQPTLFAVGLALAALWRSWGVEPDVVIGHSMGEVAAACLAGALSLNDAVAVVCRRSRLLRRISGRGEMALVELPLADAQDALRHRADRVSVAVSNSPRATVLSGEPEALAEVLAELAARQVFCRRVKVDVASHSPQVDPLRPDLLAALAELRPRRAELPLRSTVFGAPLAGPELDAEYWVANLREPVRFAETVQALLREGHALFVELGPHPVLTGAVEEIRQTLGITGAAVGSTRREQPERAALLESLATLWVHGLEPAWSGVFPAGGRRVPLPSYAWQRERHWIAAGPARAPQRERTGLHPLLGEALSLSTQPSTRVWERTIDPARLPWLADHRVRGVAVFPGAGYLEMMLSAGQQVFGRAVAVAEATFVEALVLAEEAPALVQVVASEERRVQIASRTATGAWIVHATGTLTADDAAPPDFAVAAALARLSAAEPTDGLYAALATMGFDYGPAFRGLVELRRGDGEALGRLRLPTAVGNDADYRFHPALLDACMHVIAGAQGGSDASGWLPVAVGSLRVFARPSGELWCHARLTATTGERRVADFVVVDAQGAPIAEVRGLVARRVAGGRREEDEWFLGPTWDAAPAPARRVADARIVVLGDGGGLGAALCDALKTAGVAATLVSHANAAPPDPLKTAGVAATLVSHADATDLRARLADAFAGPPPTAVVHLRGLDAGDALEETATRFLATIRAAIGLGSAPRLWLVTRGAQAIERAGVKVGTPTAAVDLEVAPVMASIEGDVAVEQAAQLGLARTAALEHPELRCTCIDLDPARPAGEVQALLAELLGDELEQEIALRDGNRLLGRVVRRPPEQAAATQVRVRGDRTYLITGGLGGLGLGVAGWLAARGAGHLVLVGRDGANSPGQRDKVAALAATTRVTVVRADVSQRFEVARIVDAIAAEGPPLGGVVHTAGVLDDALLEQLDAPRLHAVMAAKARGALHLDALTRAAPLDFFVLYASGAGLLGAPGQANYAAANAVLDALAHHRRARGLPALSVDWGLFADTGLAAALSERGSRLVARGARSLRVDEGLAVLERLLAGGPPQVGVLPLDVRAWAELVPAVAGMARFARLGAASSAGPRDEDLAARIAAAAPGERPDLVRGLVRGHVARVLRLSEARVDEDTPLTGLGMDSLMGLELKHRLRRDTSIDVPMIELLRDMTVTRLVRRVLEQWPATSEAPRPGDGGGWTDIEL
uniref:Polyketide synthase n=1 Tax=Nannocystis sp. MB1016 TaxID=1696011 RepID=A0A0M3STI5_9BACT|nr:polyketide synthase [Nannocystis sp. MB1016]